MIDEPEPEPEPASKPAPEPESDPERELCEDTAAAEEAFVAKPPHQPPVATELPQPPTASGMPPVDTEVKVVAAAAVALGILLPLVQL